MILRKSIITHNNRVTYNHANNYNAKLSRIGKNKIIARIRFT